MMNDTQTTANPLGYEKIGKLLTSYAIPSIIALIINSLYNMVDCLTYRDARKRLEEQYHGKKNLS